MRTNILYPGAFKPVHDGHLSIINQYLNNPDTNVYVIISRKDRGGLHAESTKWFLDQVFGNRRNFVSMISSYPSPITEVYDMTSMKKFGDGIYAMVASSKDNDTRRMIDFTNAFSDGGRYYTPGVIAKSVDPSVPVIYHNREDEYNESPVSATVVREDIMNGNERGFISAYDNAYKLGLVNDELMGRYYEMLRKEMTYPQVSEGGLGGHIDHPYDDNELTFRDIYNMINDLFNGKITDITEKLDGINIFASVDNEGRTIFARNKTQLKNTPMTIDDIMNNTRWTDNVRSSFIHGAEIIDKIFNEIKDKVAFFNWDDKGNRVRYRNWWNIEIIDHDFVNVIPYVENMISFHNCISGCTHYDENGDDIDFSTFTNPNMDRESFTIESAIKKVNNSLSNGYKAQMTPRLIFTQTSQLKMKMEEYINELDELMFEYGLKPESSISKYKEIAIYRYILSHNDLFYSKYPLTEKEKRLLSKKWAGDKSFTWDMFNEYEKQPKLIRDLKIYEKTELPKVLKKIMLPIDKFFMNLGNDVIKMFDNLSNKGNEVETISKIKKELVKTIDKVKEKGLDFDKDKLEYLLVRLGDETELNASEGVVFTYNGRTYKLTGSFSALNQILNLGKSFK